MVNDDVRAVHTAVKTISEYCDNHECGECYFFGRIQRIPVCALDNILSHSALPIDYEENITNYIKEKENINGYIKGIKR